MKKQNLQVLIVFTLLAYFGNFQAWSQETAAKAQLTKQLPREQAAPEHWFNLRGGVTSDGSSRSAYLCSEGTMFELYSLEACGNGSKIVHNHIDRDMTHLRLRREVWSYYFEQVWLVLKPGAGITELQVGRDQLGFHFTKSGSHGNETAGFELSTSLQMFSTLHEKYFSPFEWIADFNFGAAWLPHAGQLVSPQDTLQPFASLTIGLGF